MDKNKFGRAIRKRRLELGMSMADVAERVGCSRQAIYTIEAGSAPYVPRADAVLEALGLYMRIGSETSRTRLDV